MDTTTTKDKLAKFGRSLALLLNRGLMYHKSHPMVQESIKEALKMANLIFTNISPLVFIINRDQFFVDEEPLDPRINVKRIATLFQNHKIQSVSFEAGVTASELDILIDQLASLTMATDAEGLKKALLSKGVFNIKINHVLYKKVTEDDQIISRDALKEVTPALETEDSHGRKKFMDALLETVLTEEFANTLNIKSLLANPKQFSTNMIKADLASAQQIETAQSNASTAGLPPEGTDSGLKGPFQGVGTATGSDREDRDHRTGPGVDFGTESGHGAGGNAFEIGVEEKTIRIAEDATGGGFGEGTGYGTGNGLAGAEEKTIGYGDGLNGGGPGMGTGYGTDSGFDESPADSTLRTEADLTGSGMGSGSGKSAAFDRADAPDRSVIGISATVAGSQTAVEGPKPGRGPVTTGDTDGIAVGDPSAAAAGHGPMLLHQLEVIQREVEKQLEDGGEVSIQDLADAVFEMKRQFFEELQTQKTLGIAYAHEDAIVRNINKLSDQVILKLIYEEYNAGKITTQRLAQIIKRLIPEPQELRRLLPQIKKALAQAGMSPDAYLELIAALKSELENEDLIRILEESSEAIGVERDDLIDELKRNPNQAAKLIYLASEINKGSGDEAALTDILVDYVEKISGQQAAKAQQKGQVADNHLKQVVHTVESTLLQQLAKLNVGDDVLSRMENRINDRMDNILDTMRVEWLNYQVSSVRKEKEKPRSVLQTLEHSVLDDEELVDILKSVRSKVEKGEIEENNFSQINAEITRQRERIKKEAKNRDIPDGVLDSDDLMFILDKEIARAQRYNAPFSALAFSMVSAKPQVKALKEIISNDAIISAALDKLASTIREVDYIGQIGKNRFIAILPMVSYTAARSALSRVMNALNSKPLRVQEIPVTLRVAGVVAEYDISQTPDAQAFAKKLANNLMDMVARVKNIQVLF